MFKPGDKVRCVNPNPLDNRLSWNKIYTVSKTDDNCVWLEESTNFGWFHERFEFVQRNIKPGDTITATLTVTEGMDISAFKIVEHKPAIRADDVVKLPATGKVVNIDDKTVWVSVPVEELSRAV